MKWCALKNHVSPPPRRANLPRQPSYDNRAPIVKFFTNIPERPNRAIARFELALRQGGQGKGVGEGPAQQYARALRRFAQFIGTEKQLPEGVGITQLRELYLGALRSGRVQAPASEPIFAQTALNPFSRFLDESQVY